MLQSEGTACLKAQRQSEFRAIKEIKVVGEQSLYVFRGWGRRERERDYRRSQKPEASVSRAVQVVQGVLDTLMPALR